MTGIGIITTMTAIIMALLATITGVGDITEVEKTPGTSGMIGIEDTSHGLQIVIRAISESFFGPTIKRLPKMKKLFALIASMFALFIFNNASFADQDHGNQGRGREKGGQYHQDNRPQQGQQYQHKPEQHQQRQGQHYQSWSGYSGYRGRSPYIKDNRYREHYREYKYNGHWERWADWDRYRARNPYIYEHGHYERFENHMFFMFNDGITSFMFSIGR